MAPKKKQRHMSPMVSVLVLQLMPSPKVLLVLLVLVLVLVLMLVLLPVVLAAPIFVLPCAAPDLALGRCQSLACCGLVARARATETAAGHQALSFHTQYPQAPSALCRLTMEPRLLPAETPHASHPSVLGS